MPKTKQNKAQSSTQQENPPRIDFERAALRYTFTKLLSEHQRDVVLYRIESRFSNRLNIVVPLTRAEILNILEGLFGTGAYVLINEFDRKMNELKASKIAVAGPRLLNRPASS